MTEPPPDYGPDDIPALYDSDETTNRAAEIAVLAAYFHIEAQRDDLAATVTGSDFWWPAHEFLWDSMRRLTNHEKAVSASTLIELVKTNRLAIQALPELASTFPHQSEGRDAAAIVRALSIRRRTIQLLQRNLQMVRNPSVNPAGFVAGLVNQFTELRDTGIVETDTAITVRELLAAPDDPYDWVIPNLLERGDRFVLTGEEGQGKSVLLRQIAMCAAAGLDPFGQGRIQGATALIVDVENNERQIRRGMRVIADAFSNYARGTQDPLDHCHVKSLPRIDLLKDMMLSRLHRLLDEVKPDIVVIGPLYRLTPRAIQTDDEAAPLLAALDTIKDRGICLLMEAHAGHDRSASMRPRGSSAFLGWPEFGYGLRADPGVEGQFLLQRWRGDRDERSWPTRLERGGVLPWSRIDYENIPRATNFETNRYANPWEGSR